MASGETRIQWQRHGFHQGGFEYVEVNMQKLQENNAAIGEGQDLP